MLKNSSITRRQVLPLSAGAVASVLLPASTRPARATEPWPTKSITVVVPFPPGGQAELAAVPIAAELGRQLGVEVEVEYKTGESGVIGNTDVARAPADGSKILVALTSVATMPDAYEFAGRPVPYQLRDLRPIARILADPLMLTVQAGAPWFTIQDFIADARARPGAISFGSSGTFGTQHVAMGMLMIGGHLKFQHSAFKGAGPALKALLAGDVHCVPLAPGLVRGHVDAKRLRVLASWGTRRIVAFPAVPTLVEIGIDRAVYMTWAGVFAPSTMSEPLVSRLRAAIAEATSRKQIVELYLRAGSPVAHMTGQDFEAFVANERERLLPVLRRSYHHRLSAPCR
jgi:tripartite-type tricarboxylate transporter receptor subunit TctC